MFKCFDVLDNVLQKRSSKTDKDLKSGILCDQCFGETSGVFLVFVTKKKQFVGKKFI